MEVFPALLAVVLGYLAGSLSFARLVGKLLAPQEDITRLEVLHAGADERTRVTAIGANTAAMVLGFKAGIIIALLDMLKVALPVLAFKLYTPGQVYHLMAAVAGLLGHNWPIIYRFKGGRGFSAILGAFLVVDWLGLVVTVAASILLGLSVVGNVALAYVAWLWLMIPWLWWRTQDGVYVAYAVATNLIFLIATLPEMRTVLRYRREGKYEAYMQGLLESSPRWRGMRRIAELLGGWRK